METIVMKKPKLGILSCIAMGFLVLAVSFPVFAESYVDANNNEEKTGLFVQAVQGKNELREALARFGLHYVMFGNDGSDGPFSEAAEDVVGGYSRKVAGRLEDISSKMIIGIPEDGDELVYSWRVNDLYLNRSYLFQNGKWHLSAKSLNGMSRVEQQASTETKSVKVTGRVGPLGETIYRTFPLPRVIAALYLQSSTILGYTFISGVGTNVLVVGVRPSGLFGATFSGTVTAMIVYQ
jgi:hypothetical protein